MPTIEDVRRLHRAPNLDDLSDEQLEYVIRLEQQVILLSKCLAGRDGKREKRLQTPSI